AHRGARHLAGAQRARAPGPLPGLAGAAVRRGAGRVLPAPAGGAGRPRPHRRHARGGAAPYRRARRDDPARPGARAARAEPALHRRDVPARAAGAARRPGGRGRGAGRLVDPARHPRPPSPPAEVHPARLGGYRLKVLAVADSDSYLKWAAGLLDALPEGWTTLLTVVRTPIAPSPEQIRAAVSGTRSPGAAGG